MKLDGALLYSPSSRARLGLLAIVVLGAVFTGSCDPGPSGADSGQPPADAGRRRAPRPALPHPSLLVRGSDRALILERASREPYTGVLAALRERAAAEVRLADPLEWDHSAYGHNGCIAQANAMLAWLDGDAVAGERARSILLDLRADVETNETWDLNIRMPAPLMCHTNAWDLLQATGGLTETEATEIGEVLTAITDTFFQEYVLDRATRTITLGFSQNNHPIRTASAIGYVALAFPEHPSSDRWLDWAVSELSYLYGEDGRYVQSDGGVSEGPFYFGFGAEAALSFLHALSNAGLEDHEYQRDCINRRDVDPWDVRDCVQAEVFTFDGLLTRPYFQAAFDWSISIRLPSGQRPPFGDARLYTPSHPALLTGSGAPSHFLWDWQENEVEPMRMDSMLIPHFLLMVDDTSPAAEPPYRNRFMPAAGNAVFRSGWEPEARWLMLVAERGAARRTLHDHADGTSFSMAAYGDYLLSDTGYYKPNGLDNARTADAASHNVVLIDGVGAPEKGLLNDWGDADAFLEHGLDIQPFAWAEARQSYEQSTIVRGVAFVRERYFVIADRLVTTHAGAREHRFRVHANAGLDLGHVFEVGVMPGTGLHVARERGGVHVFTAVTEGDMRWEEPPFVPDVAPHVHEYEGGVNEHHGVADAVVQAPAPDFLSVLAPYRVGASDGPDAPLVVNAIDAGPGAVAWLVSGATFVDLVWLREEGASEELGLPSGERVTSDAALTIVSVDGSAALVARGTAVAIEGSEVLMQDASEGVAVQVR